MRVLLQKRDSRLYLKDAEHWTTNISEAADFGYIANAVEYMRDLKLPGIDMLMHFGDHKYDICLKGTN